MKPVYFPHTYLPPATAAVIRSVFPAVAGYLPLSGRMSPDMRELAASGFLELVAPAADDAQRLERIIREFERWGRLRQGGAGLLAMYLSERPGADPLTADGTATQIAAEVRHGSEAGSESPAQAALMRALVFLQLAHQADREGHEVSAALQRCERAHAGLLDALTGEGLGSPQDRAPGPNVEPAPEEDRLLEHRLRSWARLFGRRPYGSPVFVTASSAVIGLLAEEHPVLRRVGRSALARAAGAGPAPADDLMSRLEALASRPLPDPAPGDGDDCPDRAVYVMPDMPPARFFGHLAKGENPPEAAAAVTKWRHTVIVRLDRSGVPAGRSEAVGGTMISQKR